MKKKYLFDEDLVNTEEPEEKTIEYKGYTIVQKDSAFTILKDEEVIDKAKSLDEAKQMINDLVDNDDEKVTDSLDENQLNDFYKATKDLMTDLLKNVDDEKSEDLKKALKDYIDEVAKIIGDNKVTDSEDEEKDKKEVEDDLQLTEDEIGLIRQLIENNNVEKLLNMINDEDDNEDQEDEDTDEENYDEDVDDEDYEDEEINDKKSKSKSTDSFKSFNSVYSQNNLNDSYDLDQEINKAWLSRGKK